MRTFTKGKLGEIIRKLYRRYNRALVQLDLTEGDEMVEEAEEEEEDFDQEVGAEESIENASFGDGIEDEICTDEEWRNPEENTEEGENEGTEDNTSFFVKNFICDVYSKDCKRSDNLRRHKMNIHAKEKSESQSLKKYECDVCHQDCKRSDNLKRHKRRMHEKKQDKIENQCPGCKKGFANNQNLQRHMKICWQVSSAV